MSSFFSIILIHSNVLNDNCEDYNSIIQSAASGKLPIIVLTIVVLAAPPTRVNEP